MSNATRRVTKQLEQLKQLELVGLSALATKNYFVEWSEAWSCQGKKVKEVSHD